MSLESAILHLANAMERNQQGAAVAEIIRQRDESIEMHRRTKNELQWADGRRQQYYAELETERRRVRSLKAAFRRLKASK